MDEKTIPAHRPAMDSHPPSCRPEGRQDGSQEETGRWEDGDSERLLYEAMDRMARDFQSVQLELLRVARMRVKFYSEPRRFSSDTDTCLEEYLFLEGFREMEGYRMYVEGWRAGDDPFSEPGYLLQARRLALGLARESLLYFDNDYEWRNGMDFDLLADRLSSMHGGPDGPDAKFRKTLAKMRQCFLDMKADRDYSYGVHKRMADLQEESDKLILGLRDEVRLLYLLLVMHGISIPLEGHPVDISDLAVMSDPDRIFYEGDMRIPSDYLGPDRDMPPDGPVEDIIKALFPGVDI